MAVSRSATELAAIGLEYVVADLGTDAGCALAVTETERRLGPIDVLVVTTASAPPTNGWCGSRSRGLARNDAHQSRRSVRARTPDGRRYVQARLRPACIHQFDRRREAERSGSAYTASSMGLSGSHER